MNPRGKRKIISATVKRLRSILSELPDKEMFTVNENAHDLLIGCHVDGTEYRRAYYKDDFLRMPPEKFREVLNEMRDAHKN